MSKTTTTLHVRPGGRRTTISLPTAVVRLLELRKGWERGQVEEWLSDRLSERLGEVPPGKGVRPGLGRYALDEILSQIARPSLWRRFEEERYGIK